MESLYFSLTKSKDIQEHSGFKINNQPPHIKELDTFESDLIGFKSIRYRNVGKSMQTTNKEWP